MPAPPTALVDALRVGTVTRHMFFEMTHSAGVVRAWDGLRDFKLEGVTYTGVGGGHQIEGISDSGEIQNHEIRVKLNRVPVEALFGVDSNIRGESATIRIAWFTETGAQIVPPRVVAQAAGSHLESQIDAELATVEAILRGPLAEWLSPPRASYTPKYQDRLFSGDTGMQFVPSLANMSLSGWSLNPETTGGVVGYVPAFYFRDTVSFRLIGDHVGGQCVQLNGGVTLVNLTAVTGRFREDVTGVDTVLSADNTTIQVGGVNCYIDTAGDVRTGGGKLVKRTNRLRLQGVIAGNGSATATRITFETQGGPVGALKLEGTATLFTTVEANIISAWANFVYDNFQGHKALSNTGSPFVREHITNTPYVEDVTGTAVTFSGSNFLQVGGSDCHISTTGVVLSPGNRRIIVQGKDPTKYFLRIWT